MFLQRPFKLKNVVNLIDGNIIFNITINGNIIFYCRIPYDRTMVFNRFITIFAV